MPVLRTLARAILGAGMALSMSAHASLLWQGSMDDARRNAVAFITSPQGKVAGLVYSLDPVANGWKLNRTGTALQQQPFPLIQGPYAPLRPASQYGITGNSVKSAVIDVPVTITVPGKTSTVPARIIEPIAKTTLSKIGVKAIKTLPVIGNAIALSELLEEAGLLLQNGQFMQLSTAVPHETYNQTGGDFTDWVRVNGVPGVVYVQNATARVIAPSHVHGCTNTYHTSGWLVVNYIYTSTLPCSFYAIYGRDNYGGVNNQVQHP